MPHYQLLRQDQLITLTKIEDEKVEIAKQNTSTGTNEIFEIKEKQQGAVKKKIDGLVRAFLRDNDKQKLGFINNTVTATDNLSYNFTASRVEAIFKNIKKGINNVISPISILPVEKKEMPSKKRKEAYVKPTVSIGFPSSLEAKKRENTQVAKKKSKTNPVYPSFFLSIIENNKMVFKRISKENIEKAQASRYFRNTPLEHPSSMARDLTPRTASLHEAVAIAGFSTARCARSLFRRGTNYESIIYA